MARWQVLAGPPGSAPEADLTRAANRKATFRLSEPSEFGFVLPGRHEATGYVNDLATDVHLMRDGGVLYTGRVGGSGDEISDDMHDVNVSTVDYRGLLGRRYWPSQHDHVGDTGDLARTLVDGAPDLGIDTGGVADTGYSIAHRVEQSSSVRSNLDTIAKHGRPDAGFDWDVSPGWESRDLRLWTPRRGEDRGVVLDYTYTGRPRSSIVSKVSRVIDPAEYANAVRVVGGVRVERHTELVTFTDPETGEEVTETNEYELRFPTSPEYRSLPGEHAEGLWEAVIVDPELVWQAEVAARADAELAALSVVEPSYKFTLRQGAWDGPEHMWLGDTVRALIRSGRINDDLYLRVTELELELGDSGEVNVAVTVGPPRPSLLRQVRQVQRRLALR